MKISFITPYLPNLSSGSAVRAYHLLEHLSKSHDVTLFTVIYPSDEEKLQIFKKNVHKKTYAFYLPELNLPSRISNYFQGNVPYIERLKHSSFKDVIKFIPKDTDLIHLTELNSYSIVEPYIDELPGKKVLDAHNIDYLRIKSEFDSSNLLRRFAGIPVYYNLKKYEIEAIKRVDHILTCSENDKQIYAKYTNPKKITVIPNGVDTKFFNPQKTKIIPHTVFFMGSLKYLPNEYGLKWYLHNVHPLLKKKYNDYSLVITGLGKPEWLLEQVRSDNRIQFKGLVDDVRTEISKAHVCICPIFSGSGTRLKLLEYMALGKAVVSTPQGAEGIEVKDKKDILFATTTTQFVESISYAFHNQQLVQSLGKNGPVLINRSYSWDIISKLLEKQYSNLLNR